MRRTKRLVSKRTLGGCLCKALRYRVVGEAIDAAYCHCRLCRRSAGAPVLAWVTFPASAFAFTRGRPTVFRSSRRAYRELCNRCGTQLTFRKVGKTKFVDVNIVSLDHAERIVPQYHIWTSSRLPWFETCDKLPRHRYAGPDVLA